MTDEAPRPEPDPIANRFEVAVTVEAEVIKAADIAEAAEKEEAH